MTFDEIEEHRERVAGLEWEELEWEEWEELEWEEWQGLTPSAYYEDYADAYEPDDPKSPGFHDRYAEWADTWGDAA